MSEEATLDEFVETQDNKRTDGNEGSVKADEVHPRFGKLPSEWLIKEMALVNRHT